jgi:hypothetical protein
MQSALADVSSLRNISLVPVIYAPTTAGGVSGFNGAGSSYGLLLSQNIRLRIDGTNSTILTNTSSIRTTCINVTVCTNSSTSTISSTSSTWQNWHAYDAHSYDASPANYRDLTTQLQALLMSFLPNVSISVGFSEHNSRTSASYDTSAAYNLDAGDDYSGLGASIAVMANYSAGHMIAFKFGQTRRSSPSNFPYTKNGLLFTDSASAMYGGATRGAEVWRLFNRAAKPGRKQFVCTHSWSSSASTGGKYLYCIAVYDSVRDMWHILITNVESNSKTLYLDLASLGIDSSLLAVVSEVSTTALGNVVMLGSANNIAGRLASNSVWLISAPANKTAVATSTPSTAATTSNPFAGAVSPLVTKLPLSDATHIQDGAAATVVQTLSSDNWFVSNYGLTLTGRWVTLLKFQLPAFSADLLHFALLSIGISTDAGATAQAHVYGVSDNSWSSASTSWSLFSGVKQGVAAGNTIDYKFMASEGTNTHILGQLLATSSSPTEVVVDVSDFVRGQKSGYVSFAIVQEPRWNFDVVKQVSGDDRNASIYISSSNPHAPQLWLTNVVSCAAGKYLSTFMGSAVCNTCLPGSFSSGGSVSSCSPCPIGSYSPAGASSCTACSAGDYGTAIGSNACDYCPRGTYMPLAGQTYCLSCPAGSFAPIARSSACALCGGGTFQNSTRSFSCDECATGRYSSSNTTACITCAAGRFANTTLLSACYLCSTGKFSYGTGNSVCQSCSLGRSSNIQGGTACFFCAVGLYQPYLTGNMTACLRCSGGTIASTTGRSVCSTCSMGTYSLTAASVCSNCTAGNYCPISGLSEMIPCPFGSSCTPDIGSSVGIINPIPCPSGTFCNATGLTKAEICPAATYCPVGSSAATSCPAASYCPSSGLSSPTFCPVGSYCPASVSAFINCPIASYCPFLNMSEPLMCPPGTYCPSSNMSSSIKAPASYYSPGNSSMYYGCPVSFFCVLGSSAPAACTPGNYCPYNLLDIQLECLRGSFCPSSGLSKVVDCTVGGYCPTPGLSAARACDLGAYCPLTKMTAFTKCPATRFCNSTGLSSLPPLCPSGGYCPSSGLSAAIICPNRTFCSSQGLLGPVSCTVGGFCGDEGMTAPTPCPLGFFCATSGLLQGTACAAGSYCAVTGLSAGLACPAGSYCSTTGLSSVSVCPAGAYCPSTGLSATVDCAIRAFCPGANLTSSLTCPAGNVCNSTGLTAAVPCRTGTYCTSGLSAEISCPIGKFCNNTGLQEPITCTAGSYCSSIELTAAVPCPAGSYCVASATAPISCPAGTFCPNAGISSASNAVPCPIGSYCPASNLTAPVSCALGFSCLTTGLTSSTLCGLGVYNVNNTCSPCPVASFNNVTGSTACVSCAPGSFSAVTGLSVCSFCPVGFYASALGASACVGCPASSFSGQLGATGCTNCTAGTYSGGSASACQLCVAGSFSPDGALACLSCSPGSYSTAGAISCEVCRNFTYAPLSGATACSRCAGGSTPSSDAGASTCTTCAPGTFSSGGQACAPCSAGNFSGSAGATACVLCPAGQAAATAGASSCQSCAVGSYKPLGVPNCLNCTKGGYCPSAGSTAPIACPAGSFCGAEGATAPAFCVAGRYAATFSVTVCLNCAAGTYVSAEGATSCIQCSTGFSSPVGSSSCSSATCPAGKFVQVPSYTCGNCPMGKFSVSDTTSSMICPNSCAAGSYSNTTAFEGPACPACPAGTFVATTGASTCIFCAPGSFSRGGVAACAQCPINTYSTSSGASSCLQCPANTGSAMGSVACQAAFYNASSWGPCSVTCGSGIASRRVQCLAINAGDGTLVEYDVADPACTALLPPATPVPNATSICSLGACFEGPSKVTAVALGGSRVLVAWTQPASWSAWSGTDSFQFEVAVSINNSGVLSPFTVAASGIQSSQYVVSIAFPDDFPDGVARMIALSVRGRPAGSALFSTTSTINGVLVLVAKPPPPPTQTVVSAVTSSSASVSWTAGVVDAGLSASAYFVVELNLASFPVWSTVFTSPSSSVTTAALSGLYANSLYNVRVRALNDEQYTGNASDVVPFTTLPISPTTPTSLRASSVTSSTISLSWFPVEGATTYSVNITSSLVSVSYQTIAQNTGTSLIATGLPSGLSFFVSVRSANAAGASPPAVISVSTLPTIPDPPGSVNIPVSTTTASSAVVQWSTPFSGGPAASILGFTVDVYTVFASPALVGRFSTSSGSTASLLVAGLSPDTKYSVAVFARNSVGSSNASSVAFFFTLPATPTLVSLVAAGTSSTAGAALSGSTMTLTFNTQTNRPFVNPFNLFSWLTNGASYALDVNLWTAKWLSTTVLVFTLDKQDDNPPPTASLFTASYKEIGNLRAISSITGNFSLPASGPLGVFMRGSFGTSSTTYVSVSSSIPAFSENQEGGLLGALTLSGYPASATLNFSLSASSGNLGFSSSTISGASIWRYSGRSDFQSALPGIYYKPARAYFGPVYFQANFVNRDTGVLQSSITFNITVNHVLQRPDMIGVTALQSFQRSLAVASGSTLKLFNSTFLTVSAMQTEIFSMAATVATGYLSFDQSCYALVSGIVGMTPSSSSASGSWKIRGSPAGLNAAAQCLLYNSYAYDIASAQREIFFSATNENMAALNPTPASLHTQSLSALVSVVCVSSTISATMALLDNTYSSVTVALTASRAADTFYAVAFSTLCSNYLDTATVSKLGSSPSCIFDGLRRLNVNLGSLARLLPGDVLSFKANVFSTCPSSSAPNPAFSIAVASPANPVRPTVVISGPTQLGSCSDYTANALVGGLSGRPGVMQWSASGDLNSAILYTSDDRSSIRIPSGLITAGSTVTITLSVTNYFNVSSLVASAVCTKAADPLPVLSIPGSSTMQISASTELSLQAVATFASCSAPSASDALVYSWAISPVIPAGLSAGLSKLRVSQGLLSGGTTYAITCSVCNSARCSTPGNTISASVAVAVSSSPLRALIAGGSISTASISSAFVLDASASIDPDAPSVLPSYSWSCTGADGYPCVVSATSQILQLPSEPTVTVPALSLDPGLYVFSLVVSKNSRSSTASRSMELRAGSPPQVALSSATSVLLAQQTSLVISSSVALQNAGGTISYYWSADKIDLNDASICASRTLSTLVIKSSSGGLFLPGVSYVFSLKVVDSARQSGESKLAIATAAGPLSGQLTVSPTEGTALNSSFTLVSSGWYDIYAPLTCSFFRLGTDNTEIPLNDYSRDCRLEVSSLPAGSAADKYGLTIGVRVFNSVGAYTNAYANITVKPVEFGIAALGAMINSATALYAAVGTSDPLVSTMDSTLQTMNTMSVNGSDALMGSAIRSSVITVLNSLVAVVPPTMVLSTALLLSKETSQMSRALLASTTALVKSTFGVFFSDARSRSRGASEVFNALLSASKSSRLVTKNVTSFAAAASQHRRRAHLSAAEVTTSSGSFSNMLSGINFGLDQDTPLLAADYNFYAYAGEQYASLLKQFPKNDMRASSCAASNNTVSLLSSAAPAMSMSVSVCVLSDATAAGLQPSLVLRAVALQSSLLYFAPSLAVNSSLAGVAAYLAVADTSLASVSLGPGSPPWVFSQELPCNTSTTTTITSSFACRQLALPNLDTWSSTGVTTAAASCANGRATVTCQISGANGALVAVVRTDSTQGGGSAGGLQSSSSGAAGSSTGASSTGAGAAPSASPVKIIEFTLKLNADFTAMQQSPGLAEFKKQYAADLSNALKIAVSRVNVKDVSPGSIIATSTIADDPSSPVSLASVKSTIVNAGSAGIAALFANTNWAKDVIPSSYVAPTDAFLCCDGIEIKFSSLSCTSCKSSNTGTSAPSAAAAIDAGYNNYIFIGIGLVVFCTLVVIWGCRHKNKRRELEAEKQKAELEMAIGGEAWAQNPSRRSIMGGRGSARPSSLMIPTRQSMAIRNSIAAGPGGLAQFRSLPPEQQRQILDAQNSSAPVMGGGKRSSVIRSVSVPKSTHAAPACSVCQVQPSKALSTLPPLLPVCSVECNVQSYENAGKQPPAPGYTGFCVSCFKPSEYTCKETKEPVCGKDCKIKHLIARGLMEKPSPEVLRPSPYCIICKKMTHLLSTCEPKVSVCSPECNIVACEHAYHTPPQPGFCGSCVVCFKGAEFTCKQTKKPVCGGVCKQAHLESLGLVATDLHKKTEAQRATSATATAEVEKAKVPRFAAENAESTNHHAVSIVNIPPSYDDVVAVEVLAPRHPRRTSLIAGLTQRPIDHSSVESMSRQAQQFLDSDMQYIVQPRRMSYTDDES